MQIQVRVEYLKPPSQTDSSLLEQIPDGKLVLFQTKKRGVTRGRVPNQKIYGNHEVEVLLWTGFPYEDLLQLSADKLDEIIESQSLIRSLAEECNVSLADSAAALQETQLWLSRKKGKEVSENPHWTPFTQDGVVVPMSRIYNGNGADTKGDRYIQGVKLGERVISPALNGDWKTKSSPKTVVKERIKSMLPIGHLAQYHLAQGTRILTNENALTHATSSGLQLNHSLLEKVLPNS